MERVWNILDTALELTDMGPPVSSETEDSMAKLIDKGARVA